MRKKIFTMAVVSLVLLLTGCGTMMEPARKTVTLQSATPVEAYSDGKNYIGEGNLIVFDASNRSRHGDEYILLREIDNPENVRKIYLEREYNAWATWNLLWYGVPYIIDYPTGGTGRLSKTNYSVPGFSKRKDSSEKNDEIERLRSEIEKMKMKESIKQELELERTKERVLKLEAS